MKFYRNYPILILQSKVNARLYPPDFIYHHLFRFLSLLSYLYFLWIGLFFANFVSKAQIVFCQALNYSKTVPDMYICQVWLSCITCQDSSHLANILANTDSLLVLDLCHLTNTLTNTKEMTDNFTRENDNLISWQVNDADRYHSKMFFRLVHRYPTNSMA